MIFVFLYRTASPVQMTVTLLSETNRPAGATLVQPGGGVILTD